MIDFSRHFPDLDQFRQLSQNGNLIPVYKTILADLETPVSAFYKIRSDGYAFLLESVEGGENVARYSFLGSNPSLLFESKDNSVTIRNFQDNSVDNFDSQDPFGDLERLMEDYKPVLVEGLPRFHGGAVGFLSYDIVRFFEDLPDSTVDDLNLPDCSFMITETLLIFDHAKHQIMVVANAHIEGDVRLAYDKAVAQIDSIIEKLSKPLQVDEQQVSNSYDSLVSNFVRPDYEYVVEKAKEYIAAGDIIQVVPSQRFSRPINADTFSVYRALRAVNPSPYMYYLQLGNGLQIAGASPEMMVRVEDGLVETCPIAGTKPRGKTPIEDDALAHQLISDPKERAEHVMLVDLGRNDLGRVCEYKSVHVNEMMIIERYSHVMHIVSRVTGKLRSGKTAFDVIRACFPAGTLSGAPKIRAMEIIDEVEPTRRGTYGGAVGYFSFSGNADTAITIRTIVVKDGIAHVQAGGGIVADSISDAEFEETVNKAKAVIRAIEIAHQELGKQTFTFPSELDGKMDRKD